MEDFLTRLFRPRPELLHSLPPAPHHRHLHFFSSQNTQSQNRSQFVYRKRRLRVSRHLSSNLLPIRWICKCICCAAAAPAHVPTKRLLMCL